MCALFTGQSGTGKTTAAEVIAKELNLDCYRIDLSQIVSKYIGETEKNLKQIFDIAETGGVVLLFDEADALFGARGQVKEARDRYANQEVSYLLQRLETYPGVAILTTNLKDSLDTAFERRLKFIIKFPFPTPEERVKIWEKVFPPQTPTKGLNYRRLAQLSVAGGNIANIALDSAFQAARDREAVQMKHLLAAARADAERTQRILTDRETNKWISGL
ncbi:ATP-binding protein [Baaleninema simplex]|uniref:ATP-binding protein n=1 Tax=Baaleninema simplex TaxID=2862350 RepID=UPI000348C6E9|nr:ATP-binding protein [Baaleninema simplex]